MLANNCKNNKKKGGTSYTGKGCSVENPPPRRWDHSDLYFCIALWSRKDFWNTALLANLDWRVKNELSCSFSFDSKASQCLNRFLLLQVLLLLFLKSLCYSHYFVLKSSYLLPCEKWFQIMATLFKDFFFPKPFRPPLDLDIQSSVIRVRNECIKCLNLSLSDSDCIRKEGKKSEQVVLVPSLLNHFYWSILLL